MVKRYSATSLGDIAMTFRNHAKMLRTRWSSTVTQRTLNLIEADTWEAAADMLDSTDLRLEV